jgi:hypothetical protein
VELTDPETRTLIIKPVAGVSQLETIETVWFALEGTTHASQQENHTCPSIRLISPLNSPLIGGTSSPRLGNAEKVGLDSL